MTFCLFCPYVSGIRVKNGGARDQRELTDRPCPLAEDEQGSVDDGEFLGRLDQGLGLGGEDLDVFDHHGRL